MGRLLRPDSSQGGFVSSPTNRLVTARAYHTATLLPSGMVLIEGGKNAGGALASAEMFTESGIIMGTVNSRLVTARSNHSAILLPNGKVLITGGYDRAGRTIASAGERAIASAELFSDYTFQSNGYPMLLALSNHTMTYLPDGNVLIAGGWNNSGSVPFAQLYDPFTQKFSYTGSMGTARAGHKVALLANGQVLVVGGFTGFVQIPNSLVQMTFPRATAEIYCPAGEMGIFSATGQMGVNRKDHTATLLSDGKVLIAGGASNQLGTALTFDPVTGSFTATAGDMKEFRTGHTATLLPNGKVLIAWGLPHVDQMIASELYDPATRRFAYVNPALPVRTARSYHTATLLPNGKVLIAGEKNITNKLDFLNTAQLYDPATETFSPTTGSMGTARAYHTAALLSNGKVLICGGQTGNPGTGSYDILSSAELYDPNTNSFSATTGPMGTARTWHTATVLQNGEVLITGGLGKDDVCQRTAEVFDATTGVFTYRGFMVNDRSHHTATLLQAGRVLVAGGSTTPSETAELYAIESCTSVGTAAPQADLTVVAVSDPPASVTRGLTFVVNSTVSNQGNLATGTFRVVYFLSRDRILDRWDLPLGATDKISGLAPGHASTSEYTVRISSITPWGMYFLIAVVFDGEESTTTDNWLPSETQVRVTGP